MVSSVTHLYIAAKIIPPRFRIIETARDCPQLVGDGPRPVRAGSGLALGFWQEGVQRLRRSRAGPEDDFCEAVRNDLRVPLTVEGHPRTLSGPSTEPGLTLNCASGSSYATASMTRPSGASAEPFTR